MWRRVAGPPWLRKAPIDKYGSIRPTSTVPEQMNGDLLVRV